MKTHSVPFLCFFTFLLCSCNKPNTIDLPWQRLASGTDKKLNDIHFQDAANGYIVGGESWSLGLLLQTSDGGQSWTADSLWVAELNALDISSAGRMHAAGVGGRLFRKEGNGAWRTGRFLPGSIHRDLAFNEQGQGIIVSGAAFQDGEILTIAANDELLFRDSFENEFSAVCFSDDQTAHVAGYGILLRSTDGGISWTPSKVNGDFYRDIYFPTDQTGYAVGSSGSILKTTDAGLNWEVLRDAYKISVADVPFRAVFFTNAQTGYLVGEERTFWRTSDGGDSWEVINNAPPGDLLDVFTIEGKGFIVGSEGGIFTFDE